MNLLPERLTASKLPGLTDPTLGSQREHILAERRQVLLTERRHVLLEWGVLLLPTRLLRKNRIQCWILQTSRNHWVVKSGRQQLILQGDCPRRSSKQLWNRSRQ